MSSNVQLITTFYTCFQNKDYKGMQDCYADEAVFNDDIFNNLNSAQVKAMWEMLCKSGKELKLTFGNIRETSSGATAEWTASYLFSKTGNTVVNNVQAVFEIKNNKIINHTDSFDFHVWAKQAFGTTGLLLGWTPYFKNKVEKTALQNLQSFMSKS